MVPDVPPPPDPDPGISSLELAVTILAARHLYRSVKKFGSQGMVSPLVELEVLGCDYDTVKHKTKTIPDNGLNPVWDETFKLRILNPEMALIRLSIYDKDMFGDPNFIGHATFPDKLLLSGRTPPLQPRDNNLLVRLSDLSDISFISHRRIYRERKY